jgi:hypothetical protein
LLEATTTRLAAAPCEASQILACHSILQRQRRSARRLFYAIKFAVLMFVSRQISLWLLRQLLR